MRGFLKMFLWISAVLLLGLLAASFVAGYHTSISSVISMMHEEARADKIFLLVSEKKFLLLQVFFFAAASVLFFLLVKFHQAWELTRKYFHSFKAACVHVFADALPARFIFILPLASYVFFVFYFPVTYDEASTYVNFTSRSPLVSMLYYPFPNNHVMHSVITNFTRYIPFLHPLQSMRVSSVLASVLTCMTLFSLVKKYYSLNSALMITGISSVLFMYVYYSFVSRGYALVHLFFVLSMYSVCKIIFERNALRYWIYFSLFSVLGFYTMPSFLYPFLTLNLALLLNNFRGFLRQLAFGFATVVIVAAVYAPLIAVNGLEVLVNNKQFQTVSQAEVLNLFPQFASDSLAEITGIHFWIIAFLLLAALFIIIIEKQKFALKLLAAFIIAPLLLLLIHPVIPFARTFSYYSMVLPFLLVIPVDRYIEKFSRMYVSVAVILIQGLFLYSFFSKMQRHKDENMQYAEINKSIAGNHSYYLNCRLCDVTLSFELKTRNFTDAVIEYHKPLVKISADTVSNYDYILIDKIFDETKTLAPLYSDKTMNIYRK